MTLAARASKVKESVLAILEEHPETRDDDKALLLHYWQTVDGISFDQTFPRLFLTQATSTESVTRARRQIQAAGLFLPTTQEVRDQRRQLAAEARQHYAQR